MMLKRPEKRSDCGVWRPPGHFCVETIFIYNGFYKVVILISGRLPAGSKIEQHITNQEKPSTALKKVGVPITSLRFSFDEKIINDDETPKALEMSQNAFIEVYETKPREAKIPKVCQEIVSTLRLSLRSSSATLSDPIYKVAVFERVYMVGVFKHVYNKCEEKLGAFVEGVNKFVRSIYKLTRKILSKGNTGVMKYWGYVKKGFKKLRAILKKIISLAGPSETSPAGGGSLL